MVVLISPDVNGGSPASKDIVVSNPDVKELHDLLINETWQQKFVGNQTLTQQEAVQSFSKNIERQAKKAAGEKLRQEVSKPGEKDYRAGKFKELLKVETEKLTKASIGKIDNLQNDLNNAQGENARQLQELIKEVETKKDDPELINALAVWGRSPNHANERGSDGWGFNAGAIHFFEYRAFADKLGHNRRDNMTIDGFIKRSRAVDLLVNSPVAQSVISRSHTLNDETGKQARYLLTNAGELVIAYKETGAEKFKVVTIISGQNIQALNRRVEEELKTPLEQKMKRLNHLGSEVKTV